MKRFAQILFVLLLSSISFATDFSNGYTYRYLFNCSNMNGEQATINGSGFSINGTPQTVFGQCGANTYLYFNSSSVYSFFNATSQMPTDGNGTSYLKSQVWTSDANIWSVLHLDEASGNAIDAANLHNFTQSGTVNSASGLFAGGRSGYSTGNYFSTTASNPFTGSQSATYCSWVKPLAGAGLTGSTFLLTGTGVGNYMAGIGYNLTNNPYGIGSSGWNFCNHKGGVAGTESCATHNAPVVTNNWYFICGVFNASANNNQVYVNGIAGNSSAYSQGAIGAGNDMWLGSWEGSSPLPFATNWVIDETRQYTRALTSSEITNLYNNGINTLGYGSAGAVETNATSTPTANFTFISQSPSDITSTNFVGQLTNITYNVTNLTSGTPTLFYKANSSTSNVFYFTNGTATSGFQTKACVNYTNNVTWSCLLNDNQIAPATYNFNESALENTVHSFVTLSTQNDLIATQLLNVSSTKQYSFFEIMSNGTATNAKTYYYCNSTYNPATGGTVTTNSNCVQFASIAGNAPFNHTHSAYSSHIVLPLAINTSSGTIAGSSVKVTPTSYFIEKGANGAGFVTAYYIANTSRANASWTSSNNGGAWSAQTYTFDAHLHQFDGTDTLYYYINATVSGGVDNSSMRNDTFNLDPLPPTSPNVLTPTSGDKYGIVAITWQAAQNLTPQTITYNVSLYNDDGTFNSLLNQTSTTSYNWNTAGVAQLPYKIRVTAINNYSQTSFAESQNFTIATFAVTPINPASGSAFVGNEVLFSYSHNSGIAAASCDLRIDGVSTNTNVNLSGSFSYLATVTNGSHYWVVNCSDTEGAGFTAQSTNRTFTINFFAFNTQANLTSSPENVLASPQALFYDINGNLNVLYFTDEGTSQTARIKTISGSTVTASANLTLAPTAQFFVVFRNPTNTTILTRNATDSTKGILLTLSGNSLTQTPYTLPSQNALNLTVFDAYTYANTKAYTTLAPTASSYWVFTTPLATGSNVTKWNGTGFSIIRTFVNSVSGQWQTIANDSSLTTWLYAVPFDNSGNEIHIFRYNGTNDSDIATLDGNKYTAAQLSAAIVGFEKYGNKTYAYSTNISNRTSFLLIEENKTYQINASITNPSYLFFIDQYTFVFFATSGGDTFAYSCYFGSSSPTCDRLASADYGLAVPYEQGFMSSAKRDTLNQDTVVRGMIQSGSIVQLNYNTNTYDMKFICYDEQNEARKTFKQRTITATTSNALLNYSWGYVLPSASVGTGVKSYYSTCLNGTQRLFLSGLASNFSIDEYSLLSSAGVYYAFTTKDRYGSPIVGVKVSMLRFSNAKQAYVVIEQCLSDFNGGCTFFLEPYNTYKILIEANGYATQYVDFTPSSITSINIALDASGTSFSLPNYNYIFDDLTTSLTPISTLINNATNITFTVSSNQSQLEYYGMNVWKTVSNGTRTLVYSNNISTQPTGGSVLYPVTSTGRYDVQVFAKKQNLSIYEPFTQAYTFQNKSGLVKARDTLTGSNEISGWGLYFLGVVVTMVVVGFVSRYTIDGAGIVGVLVLWGFTLLNPSAAIYTAGGVVITTTIATIITTIAVFGALYLRYSATTGG